MCNSNLILIYYINKYINIHIFLISKVTIVMNTVLMYMISYILINYIIDFSSFHFNGMFIYLYSKDQFNKETGQRIVKLFCLYMSVPVDAVYLYNNIFNY